MYTGALGTRCLALRTLRGAEFDRAGDMYARRKVFRQAPGRCGEYPAFQMSLA